MFETKTIEKSYRRLSRENCLEVFIFQSSKRIQIQPIMYFSHLFQKLQQVWFRRLRRFTYLFTYYVNRLLVYVCDVCSRVECIACSLHTNA